MQRTINNDGPEYLYERPFMYPKQERAFFGEERIIVCEASTKAGKAQPFDAQVVTPDGMVPIGSLSVGDVVCNPEGGYSNVIGIYPQGKKDVYEITFNDGTKAKSCEEHLWYVGTQTKEPQAVELRELLTWSDEKLRRAWIPLGIADYNEQTVFIDPYVLGLLIGDGGLKYDSIIFSSDDEWLLDRVEESTGYSLSYNGQYDYVVTNRESGEGNWLRRELERLDLIGKGSHEKFIPDEYKYNSREVRLGVIRGILDSDGWVDRNGQPCIGQTSERLARDIEEVVMSLGGSAVTSEKMGSYTDEDGTRVMCRKVYRTRIRYQNAKDLFSLPRKRSKASPKKKPMKRTIRNIELMSLGVECVCIELDSDNKLYMTNSFIVTHNTVGGMAWLFEQAFLKGRKGRHYWWVAPVSSQAEIAFRRMKNALPREIYTSHEVKQHLTLINGAMIWFKSADSPDSLYGEDVYGAIIDEGSRVKEPAWHAVRSTLTATKGPIRIIGNVKGRSNWMYKLARMAEESTHTNMHYEMITAYDAVNAGVLDKEEIEDAKRIYPDAVFKELYLCQPQDDHGNPFGVDHIHACIFRDKNGKWTDKLRDTKPFVWGWDVAKHLNWTVGIALDKNGDVCRFLRFRDNWEATINRVITETQGQPAYFDSTGGGDAVDETLQRGGRMNFRGFKFSRQSKNDLMLLLAIAIQNRKVGYPAGRIVEELEKFEYEMSPSGNFLYAAPKGVHDDCVDALAMAYKMYNETQVTSIDVAPLEITRISPWSI